VFSPEGGHSKPPPRGRENTLLFSLFCYLTREWWGDAIRKRRITPLFLMRVDRRGLKIMGGGWKNLNLRVYFEYPIRMRQGFLKGTKRD